jgi:hypothetical protein
MLTRSAVQQVWDAIDPALQESRMAPMRVLDIVMALEMATDDLSTVVGQHKIRFGETPEMCMAQAALRVIDERLQWVRRNCAEATDEQIRHELEYARQSAFAVLVLLRHQCARQLRLPTQ